MNFSKTTATFAALAMTLLLGADANAQLVSVSGGDSTKGAAATMISAPSMAVDSTRYNLGQEGFDEQQGVTLAYDLLVDGGSIAAGTTVDSHMIFFEQPG